jgi:hypothetical protein
MKRVSFENALEAQVGGMFHHFRATSYDLDDQLADLVVANYGDRGVSFATMPSGDEGEAEPVEDAPTPTPSALSRDATPAEVATADAADDAAEERAEDRAADAPSRRGKRTR